MQGHPGVPPGMFRVHVRTEFSLGPLPFDAVWATCYQHIQMSTIVSPGFTSGSSVSIDNTGDTGI